MKHTPYWLIDQVRQKQNERDWKKLPDSFEAAQVSRLKKIIGEHIRYIDPSGTVKLRIKVNGSKTFDQLLEALGAA